MSHCPSVPFGALRCPSVPFGALRCPSVPFGALRRLGERDEVPDRVEEPKNGGASDGAALVCVLVGDFDPSNDLVGRVLVDAEPVPARLTASPLAELSVPNASFNSSKVNVSRQRASLRASQ